ncbi:MAG: hypothetical protein NZM31_08765 [Gemmatales bacterium]|nr:hypothetical protein [Gemmatales bacterium]MDW8387084.1 hypothetical protein [Gemmatales bacterium]
MTATLRWLLNELFDYAGMFPPAQLPLAEALQKYREYRRSADAWMLGGFVCPLQELSNLGRSDEAIPVCVVLPSAASQEEFQAAVDRASKALGEYLKRGPVRSVELRVSPENFDRWWQSAKQAIPADVSIYVEAPAGESLEEQLLRPLAQSGQKVGFKLRCGGATAAAVPTSPQVVQVLAACHRQKIPLKLTAGLHHPFRCHDPAICGESHGFLNMLLADALLREGKITEAEADALLHDGNAEHFRFDDEGCGWQSRFVSFSAMQRAGRGIVSIGSCSFDEPRDDLRKLGWL